MNAIAFFVIVILSEFGAAVFNDTIYLAFHDVGYLPCIHNNNSTVLLVRWFKESEDTVLPETRVALWALANEKRTITQNYNIDNNLSLTINGARKSNEGLFRCYVVYLYSFPSTYHVRLIVEDPTLLSSVASHTTYSTAASRTTYSTTASRTTSTEVTPAISFTSKASDTRSGTDRAVSLVIATLAVILLTLAPPWHFAFSGGVISYCNIANQAKQVDTSVPHTQIQMTRLICDIKRKVSD